MSAARKWLRDHSSAVFSASLFVVSLALFAVGVIWSELPKGTLKPAGVILTQLSGTILAALLAILFFSLDDVKEQIATTAASLLTSGELIGSLSPQARDVLDKQLTLVAGSPRVLSVDPSLLALLNRVRKGATSCHHLHNFFQEVTIAPHDRDPRLVVRRHVRHFRVKAYHLAEGARSFPLRYNLEVGLPGGVSIKPEDVLLEFEVIAGNRVLTRDNVEIKSETSGTTPVITIQCSADLDPAEEVDVQLACTTLGSVHDNGDLYIARYPVYGMKVSLRFRDDLLYDCAWFKNWFSDSGYRAGRQKSQRIPNGIMAFTNDWVLPGEGVMFIWYDVTGRLAPPAPVI